MHEVLEIKNPKIIEVDIGTKASDAGGVLIGYDQSGKKRVCLEVPDGALPGYCFGQQCKEKQGGTCDWIPQTGFS